MKLKWSIRFYLFNLFPHPSTEVLLGLYLMVQLFTLVYLKSPSAFVIISQLFLAPLASLASGMQSIRGAQLTVYEVSFIGSWRRVALSKLIAAFVGISPFIAAEAALMAYLHHPSYFLFASISLIAYLALILGASTFESQTMGIIVSILVIFMIPFAFYVLLLNYSMFGLQAPNYIAVMLYFLIPLLSLQYTGSVILLSPLVGIIADTGLIAFFLMVYYFRFVTMQVKP